MARPHLYSAALHNGDRMTRAQFHRAYLKTPEDFRAELIGGIVYRQSPFDVRHGEYCLALGSLLFHYQTATRGVRANRSPTLLLGVDSEPQPDLCMLISPEYGGQTCVSKGYLAGAPELVVEVARSRCSIEFYAKREDYRRHGVPEYLVVAIREQEVWWFDLARDREIKIDSDGICRVGSFPGLWIHVADLLGQDHGSLMSTLKKGLASDEHSKFSRNLTSIRRKVKGKEPPARQRPVLNAGL